MPVKQQYNKTSGFPLMARTEKVRSSSAAAGGMSLSNALINEAKTDT